MSGFTGYLPLARSRKNIGVLSAAAFAMIVRVVRVATSRRYLAEMDNHMLQDLGISRAQANFEASRAPWHIAPTRR